MKKSILTLFAISVLTGCGNSDVTTEVPVNTVPEDVYQLNEVVNNNIRDRDVVSVVKNDSDQISMYEMDSLLDTENWQTYKNEKFGFSIQYPQNWEVRNEDINIDSITIDFGELDKTYSFEGPPSSEDGAITVGIRENIDNSQTDTLKLWRENYEIASQNIKINNIDMTYFSGFGEGVIFHQGDLGSEAIVSSSLLSNPVYTSEIRPTLQAMISTIEIN